MTACGASWKMGLRNFLQILLEIWFTILLRVSYKVKPQKLIHKEDTI